MQARKLEFCRDVIRIIQDVCKLAFNLGSNNEIEKVFGMTSHDLEVVIKQISDVLPDSLFTRAAKELDEIKNIFAREFIFFQVQEKRDDPNYQDDLSTFIHIFSRDIQQKIKADVKQE
jgi:hypothetical protein